VALGADRFVFLTDVEGVKGADGIVTRHLTPHIARTWIGEGTIDGGMIPKVEACIRSLAGAGGAQIVDGRRPHVLLNALADPSHVGTTLSAATPAGR
jgi:acetylglutamate kinase